MDAANIMANKKGRESKCKLSETEMTIGASNTAEALLEIPSVSKAVNRYIPDNNPIGPRKPSQ